MPKKLLTPVQVSDLLSVRVDALANWRHRGQGPKAVRLNGRNVRYAADEVERFVKELKATVHAEAESIATRLKDEHIEEKRQT